MSGRSRGGVRPAHRPESGAAVVTGRIDCRGARRYGRKTVCADLVALFCDLLFQGLPPSNSLDWLRFWPSGLRASQHGGGVGSSVGADRIGRIQGADGGSAIGVVAKRKQAGPLRQHQWVAKPLFRRRVGNEPHSAGSGNLDHIAKPRIPVSRQAPANAHTINAGATCDFRDASMRIRPVSKCIHK